MGVLDFEQIQAAQDIPENEVDVPEWGGSVVIRGLTRQEVHDMQQAGTVGGEFDPTVGTIELLSRGVIKPELDRQAWESIRSSASRWRSPRRRAWMATR
jgi:hypothetical protein